MGSLLVRGNYQLSYLEALILVFESILLKYIFYFLFTYYISVDKILYFLLLKKGPTYLILLSLTYLPIQPFSH